MRKYLSLLLAAVVLLSSCSKDKDKKSDITKENLVGSYKLTGATSQTNGGTVVDDFATYAACEKDDLTKLNADMTYNYVDAGTKCSPAGDDNGAWSLPSTTQIVIDGQTLTIKSFDGTTLVLTYSEVIFGSTYSGTATLVKQ